MINGIQGIPGSGKSYEASAFHLLPAINSGRKVITNLPVNIEQLKILCPDNWHLLELRTQAAPTLGVWDASNLAVSPAFQLFDDGKIVSPANHSPFSSVWCFFSEWKDSNGLGPLYIIDECQVSLPRSGTSKQIQEWFQLHRHYNADVILISQNFRQVDIIVTGLLANLIICRKADILGDSSSYIRKVKAGFRGEVIQTDRRKYEAKFFSIYKSHTQSSSGAESSSRDVRPKAGILKRVTQIYWVFVLVIVAWTFWPDEPKKPAPALVAQPSKPAAPKPTAPVQEPTPKPEPVPAPTSTPAPKPQPEPEPELDPTDRFGLLDSKAVHILGSMSMGNKAIFVFEISDGQRRLFQVDSGALERSGYTVQVIDTCLVQVIAPSGKPRAVICDAPNGSTYDARRPLVIDRKTGESSWDKGSYQPYRAAAASGSL